MTKINDLVEEARALQDQAVQTLGEVPDIQTLEVLRTLAKDEVDKRAIELTLLLRKRDSKARFEVFDRWADLLEKSCLPIGAAFPGFTAVLVSQALVPASWVRPATVASYVVGGLFWLMLRLLSSWIGQKSKTGLARLGKVD